jgi:hypothetical protein
MSDQAGLARTFQGEFSAEDVYAWLDATIEANKDREVIGIRVSNNLHKNVGIAGEYKGIKIAMDPELYPDDKVQVIYR